LDITEGGFVCISARLLTTLPLDNSTLVLLLYTYLVFEVN
jgi:hypothetical protein